METSNKIFMLKSILTGMNCMKSNGNTQEVLGIITTQIFLQSIIIELAIKIMFETDKKVSAPKHHDIGKVFLLLDKKIQESVKALYKECSEKQLKILLNNGIKDVASPSFDTFLAQNSENIMHFKYSGKTNSNPVLPNFLNGLLNLINSIFPIPSP